MLLNISKIERIHLKEYALLQIKTLHYWWI